MKKKASPSRHLLLSKNFILMLVSLAVIIVTVSSWFTVNQKVTAENISVTAENTDVQIAKVLDDGGPGEFTESISFDGPFTFIKDCTGDGQNLIVPEFNITKDFDSVRRAGGKEVNEGASGKPAVEFSERTEEEPDYHYYQFQFYIRSTTPEITLGTESVLLSRWEKEHHSLFSNDSGEPTSEYGNNADGLVGAMRVSFIAEACTAAAQTWEGSGNERTVTAATATLNAPERQVLWDPRPDIHLSIPEADRDITHWRLNQITNFTDYSPIYYQNKTGSEAGVDKITSDAKIKVSDTMAPCAEVSNYQVPHLSHDADLTNFSQNNGFSGTVRLAPDKSVTDSADYEDYYLVKYTMNVWIEGTDNEARRAMDGGEFYLTLKFR